MVGTTRQVKQLMNMIENEERIEHLA